MGPKKDKKAAPAKKEEAPATEEHVDPVEDVVVAETAPAKPTNAIEAFDKAAGERHIDNVLRRKGKGKDAGAHAFWSTQPVLQENAENPEVVDIGPLEERKVSEVQPDPYPIASTLEWWSPDPSKEEDLIQIYELLRDNYVEDDDCMFRFNYSHEFLRWALMPPGYYHDWHVAVRKKSDKKMLAFISGIPLTVRMGTDVKRICEINFLCVHKNLRDKKLSPILIKEVTRRVNLRDMWQAIYTAGIVLPKPFASAQYFHRSLDPQKLIAVGFSRMPSKFEKFQKPMEMVKRHYAVNKNTQIRGLRPMVKADIKAVTALLNRYLNDSNKYMVAPFFDEADVEHWMLPVENVVYAYVVEKDDKSISDFVSFYNLPSTIIGNVKYNELRAAYTYYYATTSVTLNTLMTDALVMAKKEKFDVFNTLDILDNEKFIENLKFGPGDGRLQYYFYNWRFPGIESKNVGLVML